MEIKHQRQTRGKNCGQTCVAMLTGKPIKEVEKLYGHKTLTFLPEHVKVLSSLGFAVGEFVEIKPNVIPLLPTVAMIRISNLKRSGGHLSTHKTKRTGHLILWANGQFYDPAGATFQLGDINTQSVRITHVLAVV